MRKKTILLIWLLLFATAGLFSNCNCEAPKKDSPSPSEGCRCGLHGYSCTKNGDDDCDIEAGFFCLSRWEGDPAAICVRACQPHRPDDCPPGYSCFQAVPNLFFCRPNNVSPRPDAGNSGSGTDRPPLEIQIDGGPLTETTGENNPERGPADLPKGDESIGKICSKKGNSTCPAELFCYSEYPNDPEAYCTRRCNPYSDRDRCPPNSICEYIDRNLGYICIPKGDKKLGQQCARAKECQSGICLYHPDAKPPYFCTQSCRPGYAQCPPGYECRLIDKIYRYLCFPLKKKYPLGKVCTKLGHAACQSNLCIKPHPKSINKICSQKCSQNSCPNGYFCDPTTLNCLPKTGQKGIGEPCKKNSDCVLGLCILSDRKNPYCTQQCFENAQCPPGYECRYGDFSTRYCFPKQTQKKKFGEPCNQPGDCETNYCLTDLFKGKSFCTFPCRSPYDPPKKCPPPFICKKFNETTSYCTPKDYQLP